MSEENLTNEDHITLKELELLIKNLFKKLNKSEIVLDEIEGWNGILQFILKDNPHFYVFNSGLQLEFVEGKADDPDCTLTITSKLTGKLFSGQLDLFDAIISGKIEIQGSASHFMKLTVLLAYFEEEKIVLRHMLRIIENYKRN